VDTACSYCYAIVVHLTDHTLRVHADCCSVNTSLQQGTLSTSLSFVSAISKCLGRYAFTEIADRGVGGDLSLHKTWSRNTYIVRAESVVDSQSSNSCFFDQLTRLVILVVVFNDVNV